MYGESFKSTLYFVAIGVASHTRTDYTASTRVGAGLRFKFNNEDPYPVTNTAPGPRFDMITRRLTPSELNTMYGDLVENTAWLCHLAYGQFHIDEFKNGMAYRILKQTQEMLHV